MSQTTAASHTPGTATVPAQTSLKQVFQRLAAAGAPLKKAA